MEIIEGVFTKVFFLAAMILGVMQAYRIIKKFNEGDWKDSLMIWVKFIVCIVIVSGTADWIGFAKNVSPDLASFLEKTFEFALDSLGDGVAKK